MEHTKNFIIENKVIQDKECKIEFVLTEETKKRVNEAKDKDFKTLTEGSQNGDFMASEEFCQRQETLKTSLVQNHKNSIDSPNPSQKYIINAFRKGKSGYHGIRTIAVFSPEIPDSMTAPNDVNQRNSISLHESLKGANYVSIPSTGQREGQKEQSYTVINISRESAARYCGQYQQTGFVFYELEDNSTVKCEYWEKEEPALPYHPKQNNFVKKGETKEIIETPDSEDNLSGFNYSAVFESINESICRNLNVMKEKGFGGHNNPAGTIIDFSINRKGQTPHIYRGQLYKGLL